MEFLIDSTEDILDANLAAHWFVGKFANDLIGAGSHVLYYTAYRTTDPRKIIVSITSKKISMQSTNKMSSSEPNK